MAKKSVGQVRILHVDADYSGKITVFKMVKEGKTEVSLYVLSVCGPGLQKIIIKSRVSPTLSDSLGWATLNSIQTLVKLELDVTSPV